MFLYAGDILLITSSEHALQLLHGLYVMHLNVKKIISIRFRHRFNVNLQNIAKCLTVKIGIATFKPSLKPYVFELGYGLRYFH